MSNLARLYVIIVLSFAFRAYSTLRVQVPNNHILTQNLYYNYYYPNPKCLIIGYMDPLGKYRVSGVYKVCRACRFGEPHTGPKFAIVYTFSGLYMGVI